MAPKPSTCCLLTLFLVVLSSSAAIGSSERLQPELAAGCWKEIYQIPKCFFSIIHAFWGHGGDGSIEQIGAPCCSAFLSLTGDCQVEIFQNSSIIPLIETFCAAIVGSGGDVPPPPENAGEPEPPVSPAPETGGDMPWPVPEPEPPVAPAPGNDGDIPWPEPEPPVWAPAPEEDFGPTFPWPTVRLV